MAGTTRIESCVPLARTSANIDLDRTQIIPSGSEVAGPIFIETQRDDSATTDVDDTTTDEWGQFVDFPEDHQSDFILADPFQSLNMTVLRLRGEKIPVCKLERLAEEEF